MVGNHKPVLFLLTMLYLKVFRCVGALLLSENKVSGIDGAAPTRVDTVRSGRHGLMGAGKGVRLPHSCHEEEWKGDMGMAEESTQGLYTLNLTKVYRGLGGL
ncbi:hypothetical protein V6N11_031020 [Hibiscus sabdariffa]|uniref:Secreted protein n=2 Tax=Hibiscus sabdariffa TaxID=183260 RepID=A0ABR2A3V3_9ROSI